MDSQTLSHWIVWAQRASLTLHHMLSRCGKNCSENRIKGLGEKPRTVFRHHSCIFHLSPSLYTGRRFWIFFINSLFRSISWVLVWIWILSLLLWLLLPSTASLTNITYRYTSTNSVNKGCSTYPGVALWGSKPSWSPGHRTQRGPGEEEESPGIRLFQTLLLPFSCDSGHFLKMFSLSKDRARER